MKFGCFYAVLVPGRHLRHPLRTHGKHLMRILLQIVPIHGRLLEHSPSATPPPRHKTENALASPAREKASNRSLDVRIGSKADMCSARPRVHFTTNADIDWSDWNVR